MLSFGCYDPKEGHGFVWNGESYPGSPHCAKCRQIWKSQMSKRGLSRAQVERLFRSVGAKWVWASDLAPKKKETPVEKLGIETQQLLGRSYVQARQAQQGKKPLPPPKTALPSHPCHSIECRGKVTATIIGRYCAHCGCGKDID